MFYKWIFPMLWMGFLALWTAMAVSYGAAQEGPWMLFVPLMMAVVGVVLFRGLIWNLADEVRDGGAFLLVRRGAVEERVQLAEIINVEYQGTNKPRRVVLRLRRSGKFGDQIAFIPRASFQFNPFARHPLVESLITRVDRARQQA